MVAQLRVDVLRLLLMEVGVMLEGVPSNMILGERVYRFKLKKHCGRNGKMTTK